MSLLTTHSTLDARMVLLLVLLGFSTLESAFAKAIRQSSRAPVGKRP